MRLMAEQKLKMVKDHLELGKSLAHISEENGNYGVSTLKYLVKLYRQHGDKVFLYRHKTPYFKDTKLLGISRVLNKKESIRSVACDLGLIDPTILADWIRKYRSGGEAAVKDTFARASYLTKDKKAVSEVDKRLLEENLRLRIEIEYLKKSHSLTQNLRGITNKDRYAIVNELRSQYNFKVLLEVLKLPESSYYYHNSNVISDKYIEIKKDIKRLYFDVHKKKKGYQSIYLSLKAENNTIGKNKVLELMGEMNLLKKKKKKWRRYNSYEGDLGWVKPNLLNQDFKTSRPYEKAGTDITIFPLEEETVYFSPIIDFHTNEILAYSVGLDAKMDKIKNMLDMLEMEHGPRITNLILHSDQGVQYQNSRYQFRLKDLKILQSMSRKGNCLDNSPTESFFARMKEEMWNGLEDTYKNSDALINKIHEHIKYHNEIRPVLKLKTSPLKYKHNYYQSLTEFTNYYSTI